MRCSLVLAVLLAGAPAVPAQERVSLPAPEAVVQRLFLIGDGGRPARGGEPVLRALRRQIEGTPAPATVAFLGDNVYPSGLPAPGDPGFSEMARRLDDQLDAVGGIAARTVFIPGNHDWDKGRPDGWEAVRREEEHVAQRGDPTVSFLPRGGCPGPEVVDVGDRLRLVALDTQWWLHHHARPLGSGTPCPAGSEAEVVAGLRVALDGAAGRDVVVLAHHPLQSGGPHGGRFGLKAHLFPLTDWKKNLYLPIPLLGSLYPIARTAGASAQDIPSDTYQNMRSRLAEALRARPPLAWASGHEHCLQVIESPEWGRVLVSGAGIHGHVSAVHPVKGSLYEAGRAGFMRIDFLEDGRRRLVVTEVGADGTGQQTFTRLLD